MSFKKEDITQAIPQKPIFNINHEKRYLLSEDENPIEISANIEDSSIQVNPEIVEKCRNLREMTGLGMMDCKKLLMENEWDIDKAYLALKNDPDGFSITRLIQCEK